ncbi:MAG TPA: VWA domain-containing protein [Vicinamibacteria bacterium]|nr:VWA domain-containing protein [Vicinamibacteria bacterium]
MIFALALAAAVAAPPPTFRAAIEKVHVDAFVTRGGQVVRGLEAEDFELRDNGVAQRVELVSLTQAPLSVVLTLDTSGSVAGPMLDGLRDASRVLAEGLPAWDHVALLSFSHRLELRAPPTSARAAVARALDELVAGGSTALRDAIYAAVRIPVPDERRAVVVFSDGADNRSWLSAEEVKETCRTTGAVVYVVCRSRPTAELVTPAYGPRHEVPRESAFARELRLLAESTGGVFLDGSDPTAIRSRFLKILEEMSTRYALAFVPTGVVREGEHKLDVKVRGGKGTVRCRRGYLVRAAGE